MPPLLSIVVFVVVVVALFYLILLQLLLLLFLVELSLKICYFAICAKYFLVAVEKTTMVW